MDKRLASLPLSKEVLDQTQVIALLCLLSRVDELESRLNKHSGNSDKPPSSDNRRVVQDFLLSVLGIPVSQGAIQKIVDRGGKALHPWYEEIRECTQAGTVNHIDETSWKTGKRLGWLWVMATDSSARVILHRHRSHEAFTALTGTWSGLPVSDGYRLYRKWAHGRQTCLAHLIRRAKWVAESSRPEVASCGLWTLNELRRLCHMAKEPPTKGEWNVFYAWLMRLFALKRERKDEAEKLVRHLMRELDSRWTFLQELGVAATNNHAERLFRFPVIWRKRSFGTRTEQGEEFVERLLSFRQTCRLHGKRTYPHLVEAFEKYLSAKRPAALFSGGCEPCRNMNPAQSLLSLKLYIFTVTKAVLAALCQSCFLSFSEHDVGGNFVSHREYDAL